MVFCVCLVLEYSVVCSLEMVERCDADQNPLLLVSSMGRFGSQTKLLQARTWFKVSVAWSPGFTIAGLHGPPD